MYGPGINGSGSSINVGQSNNNISNNNNNGTGSSSVNPSNSSCVLYLGAIPYNWDVEVIKSVVCGSGPVVDVRCMMDNASKNKGFCFVEYSSSDSAAKALTLLSKIKIEGRKKLRIELSKEGLRNPVPGQKPELHLNRNFLPSNVIIPQEMILSVNGNENGPQYGGMSSMGSGLPGSKNANSSSAEISVIMSTNPQIQQMVSQMIANGMDMNQISAVVKQLTRSSQPQQQQQQSSQPPQSQQPPIMQAAVATATSAAATSEPSQTLGIPTSLSMASQFLPLPQQAASQSTIYAKDKVSETLASIPPGILIELLAKLKLALSGPSPNFAQAASILHDNPKLAAAAAQSLLLMGIIDLDVINETMSGHFAVSGFEPHANNASANSSASSSNSTPAGIASANAGNGGYFSNGQHDSNSIPVATNLSSSKPNITSSSNGGFAASQAASGSIRAPSPMLSQSSNSSSASPVPVTSIHKTINPDWLAFPQHTINKLLGISEQEASLIVQVLKLNPQQIDNLPENERRMANQIRAQYL
ncbi:DEKNAAC102052 [Brettanomyces naardenensis]|uniref:DEKNAAC102052 n=1 Tax=Brettanomyces naardenensis TaxID=13370 RepID=A0A448YJN6_BRENA|nr:DEKNAAC102052 [Brettanomyces naardenensis]